MRLPSPRPARAALVAASACLIACTPGPTPSGAAQNTPAPAATAPSPRASPTPPPAPGDPSPTPLATPAARPPPLGLELVTDGLVSPIGVTNDGAGAPLYVQEQDGRVMTVHADGTTSVFLDIADRVQGGGERGLLGLAFHPSFDADGGTFYVHYTDRDGNTVLSAFRTADLGPDGAPAAETVLLTLEQPFANHNGGQLAFGPDGYLYMGLGDGGSAGDPLRHGQNTGTLLGAILRLEVGADPEDGYAIPPDNPFVDGSGAPEVWVYGLRNPWRFSFDRATGDLWIGDVGQGAWEEIDRLLAGAPAAANFGWSITEGNHCFDAPDCTLPADYVPPITEYDHSHGCSVTGGVVYRGEAQPSLRGYYVFGDYCSGLIWAIRADATHAEGEIVAPTLVAETDAAISSFGEDVDGELYLTDLAGGRLYRVVADP